MDSLFLIRVTVVNPKDGRRLKYRSLRITARDAGVANLLAAAQLEDEGLGLRSRITSTRYIGEAKPAQ